MINRRRFIQTGAAGLAVWGCSDNPDTSVVIPGQQSERSIVFRNGTVLPIDTAFSEHTTLAIKGNQILAVGDEQEVLTAAGKDPQIVDLDGRVLMPGFIEPHMHFALIAGFGTAVDVGAFVIPDFDGVLAKLSEINQTLRSADDDRWVLGRQFDPILLEPARDLTTRELDAAVPDRPAFILNASGHIAYVNSRTLKLAGLTAESPEPQGAEFGRYEDGNLNGILYGPNAYLPVLLKNKEIAARMTTSFVEAGLEVGELAASMGITTLCDQATGALSGPDDLEFYRRMYDGGAMKARIRAYVYGVAGGWDEAGVRYGDGDALMRVAGWKIVVDGSNQGFTGRQREPYYTRDTKGLYYVLPEVLESMVTKRGKQGWPLSIHGNGDAAIDTILDSVEAARDAGVDVEALRCRIEHCSILHDDQIARMKSLGMQPSFLINHVHYWGHVMRDQVFGPEKVQLLDRCASVENAGLTWVNHTDAPVSPLGSLHKVRVAVARDLWKEPETVLAPQERVTVEAALRAVTRNAAWGCHSEHEIGSLEPGKLADMVVLEEDPRKIEPTAISDIKISETWMDGRQVYG